MKSVTLVFLGFAVVAIPIFSQTPTGARPQFEVASIKVHPPPLTRIVIMPAGPERFVVEGFSLKMLVARAYAIPDVRILGGPGWVDSERYDIEAKADAPIAQGQMPLLIQSLLEDRFQLKAHKETRELPAYELVAAKGGVKLKLSEDQTPPGPLRGATPGGLLPRGAFRMGRGNLQGTAVGIDALVNFLTNQLGRPVYDKTEMTGLFDVKLDWTPGTEAVPGPFGPTPNGPPPPADPTGPSLFTALQEQLGLRLESTKAPVEVVIIDGAQKPSEN